MRVIQSLDEMKETASSLRAEGKTIALVPTMGYLHEGHLSLVDLARRRCDIVIVSIFVRHRRWDWCGDSQIAGVHLGRRVRTR